MKHHASPRTSEKQRRRAAQSTHAGATSDAPRAELTFESLQRVVGNAAIQRLIQRYAVPGNLACDDVADWITSNSPYAPEWAETHSTFTFNGQARVGFKTLPDGSIEAHVLGHNGLSVSVSSPIDRPEWNPSRRQNRAAVVAAWQAMRASLDAHENQHRRIAEQERVRIQGEFRSLDFTVTGADRPAAQAAAAAEMQSRQAQWQADSQAAQDAIDPFRGAVLTCPAPAPASTNP